MSSFITYFIFSINALLPLGVFVQYISTLSIPVSGTVENSPIPVMLITDYCTIEDPSYILWYSKENGWMSNGKSISGPKEFVLSFVDEIFVDEDEIEGIKEIKETLIELVNKYL